MEQRTALEEMGKRILAETRTGLYLAMRFMGPALDALPYRMDLTTRTAGTDGREIRFNPVFLRAEFLESPRRLRRFYMHLLLHCLFRHLYIREKYEDPVLFDLCADIAVELLIDSMDEPALYEVSGDFRRQWKKTLTGEVEILTAEKLYHYFTEKKYGYDLLWSLESEFRRDDHQFWNDRRDDRDPPPPPRAEGGGDTPEEEWRKRAENTRDLMAGDGPEAADETGALSWTLALENASKTDYREFLRHISHVREEVRADPDGFDYGYYHYGLSVYGNMPLIEENEFRETAGVDDLVIAIDTSGSTKPHLVEQFLKETAAVLETQETFFHRTNIYLIECDNQVRREIILTSTSDLQQYACSMEIRGGMGTDFRPVFDRVAVLRRQGKLPHLRGLLYFTDGYGIWPEDATDYDTAFVFCTARPYNDKDTPDWAIRLYASDPTEE